MQLHWHFGDDVLTEGEVYDTVRPSPSDTTSCRCFRDDDPYLFFQCARAINVTQEQRLSTCTGVSARRFGRTLSWRW